MSVLMILCAFALAERGWQQTLGEHVTGNSGKKCVVIDAGHGGNDPGKIGVDDSREKDLNLVIADKEDPGAAGCRCDHDKRDGYGTV